MKSIDGGKNSAFESSGEYNDVKYRELIRMLKDDGWRHVRTTGSHLHYQHATKPGTVTVPGGGKANRDVAPGTLRSILRQAQINMR